LTGRRADDACAIVGVGLTRFGKHLDRSLRDLAAEAIQEALSDAGLAPDQIDAVFVANTVSAVTTGQVAVVGQVILSGSGISGVPVYNVDNACAGSSTALNLATYAIAAGAAQRALVVGVEKMFAPDRALTYRALNGAADIDWVQSTGIDVERDSVFMKEVYAARLRDYEKQWPLDEKVLAKIAVKNRAHAQFNDKAQYRESITLEDVLASRVVQPPIRAFMCSPIADGASAAVVAANRLARAEERAVWIRASRVSMGSPPPRRESTIGRLAAAVYRDAGVGPDDLDVVEVHDATAFSELLAYEELGLCQPGQAAALVETGATSLGGRIPVNPSGGLESRGHPLAATGVAQIVELTTQLRGEAGQRQVPGAKLALAETAGGFVSGDSAAVALTILAGSQPRDRVGSS
jgi:acetyl-CoA acyltransferase